PRLHDGADQRHRHRRRRKSGGAEPQAPAHLQRGPLQPGAHARGTLRVPVPASTWVRFPVAATPLALLLGWRAVGPGTCLVVAVLVGDVPQPLAQVLALVAALALAPAAFVVAHGHSPAEVDRKPARRQVNAASPVDTTITGR